MKILVCLNMQLLIDMLMIGSMNQVTLLIISHMPLMYLHWIVFIPGLLENFLRNLALEFRDKPENLIALVPAHEWEVNIGDGAGDYNPAMITGFKKSITFTLW